ncbi:MAG: LPS export ABC transporter permease LptF [Sulfitobacter sp.]
MTKFDRYLLSQLLVLFGFFSLVLVAVFWINRAVGLFDRLIGDGQSALVFLEFTALGLPKLIATVLPIATFAAAVYITNRLNNESELTVMSATGSSPWRLARPVLFFGLITALMMLILVHILAPLAQAELTKREAEISKNVTARLLTDGAFLNPTAGVTFYTREIAADGVLHDVFLSDRRDPSVGVIYTAAQAYLVRNGPGTNLIMVDGLAQRLTTENNQLSTAKFSDFAFDITALVKRDAALNVSARALSTPQLLASWDTLVDQDIQTDGQLTEEFHARFAQPIFCAIAALIGFSTLLIGGYSRFGVWREVVIAFGLLIAIDGMRSTLRGSVREDPQLWALMYLPALIGALLIMGMLMHAAYPARFRRKRQVVAP